MTMNYTDVVVVAAAFQILKQAVIYATSSLFFEELKATKYKIHSNSICW